MSFAHLGRDPQPRTGRKPKTWITVDRDYENLRICMQALFGTSASRPARSRIDNIASIRETQAG
jgi:hypothetical protein